MLKDNVFLLPWLLSKCRRSVYQNLFSWKILFETNPFFLLPLYSSLLKYFSSSLSLILSYLVTYYVSFSLFYYLFEMPCHLAILVFYYFSLLYFSSHFNYIFSWEKFLLLFCYCFQEFLFALSFFVTTMAPLSCQVHWEIDPKEEEAKFLRVSIFIYDLSCFY